MDVKLISLLIIILGFSRPLRAGESSDGGRGTYNVGDAWEQLNSFTASERTGTPLIPEVSEPATAASSQYRASSRASKKGMDIYDSYASASGYGGGYGSGGGYGGGGGGYGHGGGGYGGYSLNKSAVALLGFLYLLNLIQDILQQTTTAGRKKRESFVEELISKAGLSNGVEIIAYDLAATILPLMADFAEINDTSKTPNCVEFRICSSNQLLASKYGPMGRVLAQLTTDSILDHFELRANKRANFIEAAKHGRNRGDCFSRYPQCK